MFCGIASAALGIGHNSTLSHRISWTPLMIDHKRIKFDPADLLLRNVFYGRRRLGLPNVEKPELQAVTTTIQTPTGMVTLDAFSNSAWHSASIVTLSFSMPHRRPYTCNLVYRHLYMFPLCSQMYMGICAVVSSRTSYLYCIYIVTTKDWVWLIDPSHHDQINRIWIWNLGLHD